MSNPRNAIRFVLSLLLGLLGGLLVVALLAWLGAHDAYAAEYRQPPVTQADCERFGCLYSHTCQYHERPGSTSCHSGEGIAHDLLPDGPDGRKFVTVLWPMVNDSTRATPDRFPAWDRVIRCESGGNAQAKNPHSSASGLFQIVNGTWRSYGGSTFASQARWAHPMEQLVIAERILWAGHGRHGPQGPRAWSCSGAPGPQS